MKKRLLTMALALTFALSLMPSTVRTAQAATGEDIYVKLGTDSNGQALTYPSTSVGDGSKDKPYISLLAALDKAAQTDGTDTIYIMGSTFLNTIGTSNNDQQLPLLINTPVTITSYGDTPASLILRPAGIVLGADVTFDNVNIQMERTYHNAIYANGHNLTLNNVVATNCAVNVVAGSLYVYNTRIGSYTQPGTQVYGDQAPAGSKPVITISGERTQKLGGVFAGGMCGPYEDDVTFNLTDLTAKALTGVYSCNVAEQTDKGIDLSLSGADPFTPDDSLDAHPAYVNVKMENSVVGSKTQGVNGAGSDGTTVYITGSAVKNTTCLENITGLVVSDGATASPYGTIGANAQVSIGSGSVLELARTHDSHYQYTLGGINGETGSTLALAYDGHLTVDSLTGSLRFVTQGYTADTSGVTYAEHTYITVNDKDSIEPSFTHSAYSQCSTHRLARNDKDDGSTEWFVTAYDESGENVLDDSRVNSFSITSEPSDSGTVTLASIQDSSKSLRNHAAIPISITWADGKEHEIAYVPFSFTVYKDYDYQNPDSATTTPGAEDGEDAYLNTLKLWFAPVGTGDDQKIYIYPYNGTPAAGVYDISISVPKEGGGSLNQSYLLTITDDSNSSSTTTPTATTATTVTDDSITVGYGETATITANITGENDAAVTSGTATLVISGTDYADEKPISNGTATWDVDTSSFSSGEHPFRVVYGGDTDTTASNASGTLTVNPIPASALHVNCSTTSITADYDGEPHGDFQATLSYGGKQLAGESSATIEYCVDGNWTPAAPTEVGTYNSRVSFPAGDYYGAVTEYSGPTVTIRQEETQTADTTPATPLIHPGATETTDTNDTTDTTQPTDTTQTTGDTQQTTDTTQTTGDTQQTTDTTQTTGDTQQTTGATETAGDTQTTDTTQTTGSTQQTTTPAATSSDSDDSDDSDTGSSRSSSSSKNNHSTTVKTDGTAKTDGSTAATTTTTTDPATGAVTETVKTADGVTGSTVMNSVGAVTQITAEIPADTARSAAQSGKAVMLPIHVQAASSAASAPTVDISLPDQTVSVTVEIPVSALTPGTVAILVQPDGTETVVKSTLLTDSGVALPVTGDAHVKVVDNSQHFSDVPEEHWASQAITYVTARELFSGTGNGDFSADGQMTRAMVAQVLYSLTDKPAVSAPADFTDVPEGAWYSDAVAWAAQQGLVSGYGDGSFGAGDSVTREQLAFLLWKYAGSPAAQTDLNYQDSAQISAYAQPALQWASEQGIVSGTGNGVLAPQGLATRAQVAQMMKKFMETW